MLTRVGDEKLAAIPEIGDVRLRILEDAVAFYTRLIALNPGAAQAYLERAGVHRLLANFGQERADLERAVELSPGDPEPHAALAHVLRAAELGPSARTLGLLAQVYRRMGRVSEAAAALRAAAALAAGSAEGSAALGEAAAAVGEPREARSHFQRAAELSPADPWGHHRLAGAHTGLGEDREALAVLNRGLELRDISGHARGHLHARRAEVYVRLREYERALADYDWSFAVNPEARANWSQY